MEVDLATGETLWTYDNLMDFAPFLKARRLETNAGTFARPPLNGAYYVPHGLFAAHAQVAAADLR
jgi:hypothetical protein